MERVLNPRILKSLILLLSLLACAQTALATTVVMPPDDQMIIEARAIIRGRVLAIESGVDNQDERIYTYVTVKVKEVLKGEIDRRKIVIKQPGGQYGTRGSIVFGVPEFAVGESVLLYLDTWRDGSLRVHQMLLGKFNVVDDPATGKVLAVRNASGAHVQVIGQSDRGPITNSMELKAYESMVRSRLEVNRAASQSFQATVYRDVSIISRPAAYTSSVEKGDIEPQYHLWNPPTRWFEADTGQSVSFKTNPASAPSSQVENDVAAATVAWSTIPGCSLRVVDGGTTTGCGLFTVDGENTVSFNNCDGYFSGSGSCSSGILAVTSIAQIDYSQVKVVNGTSFYRALESNLSFNPYASCYFSNHCNLQEIMTHEMGHALGLHHSWDSSFPGSASASDQVATMYWVAHFDGRCASLRTDDINGITFIYPGTGGGPGPLSVSTTSLPNGTVGSSYNQSLTASGGTTPYSWSLVAGQGALPAGLSLSSAGVITGTPTSAGTSNFTVKVTDAGSTSAQKALSIVVNSAGALSYDAQFVSQTVPSSVTPGQQFMVNLKFLNTGTQTWSGTNLYWFASQNPSLNQTWGGNGVPLDNFMPIAAGQQLDVSFQATAPATAGVYNFQWQMYKNDGSGYFGQMSTNVSVQVGSSQNPSPKTAKIGLYTPFSAAFFLRNSNTGGIADMTFTYGPSGLGFIPLVGDWDGDGIETPGLYDPQHAAFFLRNSNSGGMADLSFTFGPAGLGWIPIVGDWNGDGIDTIGLYDPAHAAFFLTNSNTGGVADISFTFGPAGLGWIPIVGDWNGDGIDTIGLYDPTHAAFFLRNSNTGGTADVTFTYGPAGLGWVPMVGDWNGDGTDTIGLYDPAHAAFFLRNSNSSGIADVAFTYGPASAGFIPVVGDWNGQ